MRGSAVYFLDEVSVVRDLSLEKLLSSPTMNFWSVNTGDTLTTFCLFFKQSISTVVLGSEARCNFACQFSGNIQKQLSQIVCVMGKYDFPAEWPDLISLLAQNLDEAHLDKLTATLSTLDELCRHFRYEMKSDQLWRELLIVLQAVGFNMCF